MTKSEVIKEFFKRACCPWRWRLCCTAFSNPSAQKMESPTMYGCSSFAVCLLASTDVCLDRAGRLFGNRPSVVSAELYYWRSDRRFRPGLATAGVYLVYSLDHLSTVHNKRDFLYSRIALWKCGKRPLHRWKTNIYDLMEKLSAFPQPANTVSHSAAPLTVYTHSHSAYYCY